MPTPTEQERNLIIDAYRDNTESGFDAASGGSATSEAGAWVGPLAFVAANAVAGTVEQTPDISRDGVVSIATISETPHRLFPEFKTGTIVENMKLQLPDRVQTVAQPILLDSLDRIEVVPGQAIDAEYLTVRVSFGTYKGEGQVLASNVLHRTVEDQRQQEIRTVNTATVKNNGTNLREAPNTSSKVLKVANANEKFTVVGDVSGEWIQITYTSGGTEHTAYIHSDLVNITSQEIVVDSSNIGTEDLQNVELEAVLAMPIRFVSADGEYIEIPNYTLKELQDGIKGDTELSASGVLARFDEHTIAASLDSKEQQGFPAEVMNPNNWTVTLPVGRLPTADQINTPEKKFYQVKLALKSKNTNSVYLLERDVNADVTHTRKTLIVVRDNRVFDFPSGYIGRKVYDKLGWTPTDPAEAANMDYVTPIELVPDFYDGRYLRIVSNETGKLIGLILIDPQLVAQNFDNGAIIAFNEADQDKLSHGFQLAMNENNEVQITSNSDRSVATFTPTPDAVSLVSFDVQVSSDPLSGYEGSFPARLDFGTDGEMLADKWRAQPGQQDVPNSSFTIASDVEGSSASEKSPIAATFNQNFEGTFIPWLHKYADVFPRLNSGNVDFRIVLTSTKEPGMDSLVSQTSTTAVYASVGEAGNTYTVRLYVDYAEVNKLYPTAEEKADFMSRVFTMSTILGELRHFGPDGDAKILNFIQNLNEQGKYTPMIRELFPAEGNFTFLNINPEIPAGLTTETGSQS